MSSSTSALQRLSVILSVLVIGAVACSARVPPAVPAAPAASPAPQPRSSLPEPSATSGLVSEAGPGAEGQAQATVQAAVPTEAPEPPVHYAFQDPMPEPGSYRRSPATRYANLSAPSCRAELRRRKLPTRSVSRPSPGVATPVRLTGALGGVRFITPGEKSIYGTLDCRLVLALDDFAKVLAEHAVTAVHVDNFYRPKAHLPGKKSKRSQHAYGLAIDVMAFTLADGRTLLVERDFLGSIGAPSCGPGAELAPPSEEAAWLRNIACAAARAGVFHHLLTPNFNAAHEDHLHLDIKRGGGPTVIR